MDIVTADQNAPPVVKDLKVSASLLGPRVLVVPVPLQVFLIFLYIPHTFTSGKLVPLNCP